MNQQIEQILFGNVGNRMTRELAAGMFLAISESVAAEVSRRLSDAASASTEGSQADKEVSTGSARSGLISPDGGFPAPVGMHVDLPESPTPAKRVRSAGKRSTKA